MPIFKDELGLLWVVVTEHEDGTISAYRCNERGHVIYNAPARFKPATLEKVS